MTIGIAPDQPLLRALLNNSLQQIPPESFSDSNSSEMRPISLFVLVAAPFADLPQRLNQLAHHDEHYLQRLCRAPACNGDRKSGSRLRK